MTLWPALDERKVLLCHAPFQHSYPHCWRHKTPIIFRATPQWFVSMTGNGLLAAAKSAVEDVQWIPDWGPGTYRQHAGATARLVHFPPTHLGGADRPVRA
jgi:isoleucyl-tRNA synthetase